MHIVNIGGRKVLVTKRALQSADLNMIPYSDEMLELVLVDGAFFEDALGSYVVQIFVHGNRVVVTDHRSRKVLYIDEPLEIDTFKHPYLWRKKWWTYV